MNATTTKKLSLTPQITPVRASFKPRQPGSAYTHLGGAIFAVLAAFPLLGRAFSSPLAFFSCAVFILSMFLLYGASTLYHTFGRTEKSFLRLKKLDHLMIYVLIAGTYTPVCLLGIRGNTGLVLLCIVWGIALIGVFQCLFFIHCPKWVSAIIYIAMGWCCLLAFPQLLHNVDAGAFALLLSGGILYTAGGVLYALRLPFFDSRHPAFGLHEIFHCFCLAGSFFHFLMVYSYLI